MKIVLSITLILFLGFIGYYFLENKKSNLPIINPQHQIAQDQSSVTAETNNIERIGTETESPQDIHIDQNLKTPPSISLDAKQVSHFYSDSNRQEFNLIIHSNSDLGKSNLVVNYVVYSDNSVPASQAVEFTQTGAIYIKAIPYYRIFI
ncbi:MAG TPA: hypothetical protein VG621_01490 [Candidatus Paceibacterota bacterium]|nr:hypothetical protein [Candidatus Paceibacterota bacterium]